MTAELDVRIAEMMGWSLHCSDEECGIWLNPAGEQMDEPPPFSTSLDAVVEWLVPFMAEQGFRLRLTQMEDDSWEVVWFYQRDIVRRGIPVLRAIPTTAACEAALAAVGGNG